MKKLLQLRKNGIHYFSKHVEMNALSHALGGIALGILIAGPFAFPHPIRWAFFFLVLGIIGHLIALFSKPKK